MNCTTTNKLDKFSSFQQKYRSPTLLIKTCFVVSLLLLFLLSSDISIYASTQISSSSSLLRPLSLSDPSSPPTLAVAIPEAQTCKECFTDILASEEMERLETSLDDTLANAYLDDICAELELEVGDNPVGDWMTIFHAAGIADQEKVDSLIECLKEAGIVFQAGG